MFVMSGAVLLATEEVVLEGVFVSDVRVGMGFEDGELVCGVGRGAKEAVKERLQVGLEWVSGTGTVVEAFMCSS